VVAVGAVSDTLPTVAPVGAFVPPVGQYPAAFERSVTVAGALAAAANAGTASAAAARVTAKTCERRGLTDENILSPLLDAN
jgi:hypothetical protein